MFSRIDFVHMPHGGWMKNDSLCTQKWMKLKILTLVPTPLGGFSPFSWWPFYFIFLRWFLYSNIVISNKYTFYSMLESLWLACCPCHIRLIFAQLFNFLFCNIFVRSLWSCPQSNFHLWSLQILSHRAMKNNLRY